VCRLPRGRQSTIRSGEGGEGEGEDCDGPMVGRFFRCVVCVDVSVGESRPVASSSWQSTPVWCNVGPRPRLSVSLVACCLGVVVVHPPLAHLGCLCFDLIVTGGPIRAITD